MNDLATAVTSKAKSFWDTKEGTTGMVFGLGILGALGYGAYKIMPFIANLLENTVYAIAMGLIACGLAWVFVIDGTMRNRLWIMYKLMMRALTYSIIKYDPIGILREIQKKAKERIKLVDDNRLKVSGQVRTIKQTIDSFKTDESRITKELEYMQRQGGSQSDLNNKATRLGKLREAEIRLQKSYDQTKGFYDQLTRAFNALGTIDENIDFEIGIMEREYKAVNASHAAWKAVKAAFKGSDQIDDLRNDTLAFLAEDYGSKLGQIESFMQDSEKFINGVELQDAMYADSGMKIIEELNSRNLDVVQSKSISAPSQGVTINLSPQVQSVSYTVKR